MANVCVRRGALVGRRAPITPRSDTQPVAHTIADDGPAVSATTIYRCRDG